MELNHINEDIRSDCILCRIIIGFYYAMIVNNILKRLLNISSNSVLIVLLAPIIIYSLNNFLTIKKQCLNVIVFSELIVIVLYTFSYLFGTPYSVIIQFSMQTLVFVFFGGIIYGINDYSILAKSMKRHSYLFLILLSFVYLKKDSFVYIMSHSYLMLIPTLLHITIFLTEEKRKLFHFLLIIYELYTILTIGSRGPLLVIFIYSLILGLISVKNLKMKLFLIIAFVLVYYSIFINGDNSYKILQSIGINSRSLMLIFTDREYDSGRSDLAQKGIELIQQRPWFGWGVAGDSQFMGGGYVHNIFIELKIDFGVIMGTIAYVSLWISYFIALIRTNFSWIIVMMICVGFIPLFVSNSYLLSYDFILSVFMAMSVLIKHKKDEFGTVLTTG